MGTVIIIKYKHIGRRRHWINLIQNKNTIKKHQTDLTKPRCKKERRNHYKPPLKFEYMATHSQHAQSPHCQKRSTLRLPI